MKQFPAETKFKFPWRQYQQRVLDELESHLEDDHLHVVAPPGSGKTVLGLEVAVRLNTPVLILAPSIAIRNQWVQRFVELFLQMEQSPSWISCDIREPGFMTVTTYQALHAACTGTSPEFDEEEAEEEPITARGGTEIQENRTREIIAILKKQGVQTIVVDEAHHLKNAWWKSLTAVKDGLEPAVVGLTATPPYDVSYAEWQRYIDLNGPVDAEISVPELMLEGDLCPHQDYVYLSGPTVEEYEEIRKHNERIDDLVDELVADPRLADALLQHPSFSHTKDNLEWIYSNFDAYAAILIYLSAAGYEIPIYHLQVVAGETISVPKLTNEYLETLLSFYLYQDPDNFIEYKEHQKALLKNLKRHGVVERKSIELNTSRKVARLLSSSTGKLQGIGEIAGFEHEQLGDDLRMVILTDYIRKEFLVNRPTNELPLNKIGVMPIFEHLRRSIQKRIQIGVLSGSLVIIPTDALEAFKEAAQSYGIEDVGTQALPYDERYLIIQTTASIRHDIVQIFTKVFRSGAIQVIVGTKSLLGEGWDAPSINSLVLASFVGSHVLSNQMRGRAIRKDRASPDKTGNIWHLVCVDYTDPEGGEDVRLLKRRFRSFVGCSFKHDSGIENGYGRLDLPERFGSLEHMEELNDRTFDLAADRDSLQQRWESALEKGSALVEELKVPFPDERGINTVKGWYTRQTIKYLLITLGFSLLEFANTFLEPILRDYRLHKDPIQLVRMLWIIGFLGILFFGWRLIKVAGILIRFRDISKDIRSIAEALLVSLMRIGSIRSGSSGLEVCTEVDAHGGIYCHLKGANTFEKSLFIKSLKEIIGRIENPRYIIVRKHRALRIISQKDFHSVPDIIGRNKTFANGFAWLWKKYVGKCRLVFTRSVEGRHFLLKARINSLSARLEPDPEQVKVWR